ncbi:HutD family protein [Thalassomonas sp. M1454]|uniref:HutD/Ves family protein n=1 Tax=Thalassomonas sp. M1454 TaxID=2594477 RepID=UPI00117C96B1|nr:HutD family protein [Thalassomonas sp. M1454]TRX56553.1 HutD family protein [Thalassomonas sp. M1454]
MDTMKITSPEQFKTTPWKNGKGKTIELAINDNGDLNNFSYRLSIATVSEDGLFSNFSGLQRNLFLLSGTGIELSYDKNSLCDLQGNQILSHTLKDKLSYATFDGDAKTFGKLLNGTITDFNVIHNDKKHQLSIHTIKAQTSYIIDACSRCFIYPTHSNITISDALNTEHIIRPGHLIELNNIKKQQYKVTGTELIVVHFNDL